MKTPSPFTGLTQNDLIHELQKTGLPNMPVRVIRVDVMENENLRIESVDIVNGEVLITVDRY